LFARSLVGNLGTKRADICIRIRQSLVGQTLRWARCASKVEISAFDDAILEITIGDAGFLADLIGRIARNCISRDGLTGSGAGHGEI